MQRHSSWKENSLEEKYLKTQKLNDSYRTFYIAKKKLPNDSSVAMVSMIFSRFIYKEAANFHNP